MLPKPEKIKKLSSSHQLDLVESVSMEEKISQKRRILFWALFLTIGLSLLFWGYHLIVELLKSPRQLIPKISTPEIKLNKIDSQIDNWQSVDGQITKYLRPENGNWNIYIQTLPSGIKDFNWSKNNIKLNETEITDNVSKIKKLNIKGQSLIQSVIPQGLNVREIITHDQQLDIYQFLIDIPNYQLFIGISINDGDVNKNQAIVINLVGQLYWSIIANLPIVE